MKTIEVIPPIQLRDAVSTSSPEGAAIYYPAYLFNAELFIKPVVGAEKKRQFAVLVDAVDGVAQLYRDMPAPQTRKVNEADVIPSRFDEEAARSSAEKALDTYALRRYRGLSPTRTEVSPARLVHKVFFVRMPREEGKPARVLDGLTGKETELP